MERLKRFMDWFLDIVIVTLFVLLIIGWVGDAEAAEVSGTLSWEMPTERENGNPVAPGDIEAIKLYFSIPGSDVWTLGHTLFNGATEVDTITIDSDNGVLWVVTAVDVDGVSSRQSNEVLLKPSSPLKAPVLQVQSVTFNNYGGTITIVVK